MQFTNCDLRAFWGSGRGEVVIFHSPFGKSREKPYEKRGANTCECVVEKTRHAGLETCATRVCQDEDEFCAGLKNSTWLVGGGLRFEELARYELGVAVALKPALATDRSVSLKPVVRTR